MSSTDRRSVAPEPYVPIVARSRTFDRPVTPVAYDCVTVAVVRSGSAIVFSEFGARPVALGDVITLNSHTLCGYEPEGWTTLTTLYLDRDYLVDQVFWQHAALLADRLDADDFLDQVYSVPAQVLRLGDDRASLLMPWLDELTALSLDGPGPDRFYRMQSLVFAVLDVLIPFVQTTPPPIRTSESQRARIIPAAPRLRQFLPLRVEAAQARDLLRESPGAPWTLGTLAEQVHLSQKQLSRVFVEAYGKTPLAYLTMLRVERMAELLRDRELSLDPPMGRLAELAS
ncbi:AraC family transcriptional regulator [Gordonia paraffinivorans]|nr:AraC family transcriptional regulator [Gordonia paraffinivorans]